VFLVRTTTEQDLDRHPDLDTFEGFLWRREGARLARLASLVPAGECIVELGSNRGKSTCFLARGSKAGAGVKVHAVDLWTLGGQGEYQHLGFDLPETLDTFRAQVARAKVKSLVVEHHGSTVDVAAGWQGPTVGLLFVDADHRYESVCADLDAWAQHLALGAWVCFHDYTRFEPKATQFPGVVRAVDEWIDRVHPVEVTRTGRLVAARLS
jgi:hypothetical protein